MHSEFPTALSGRNHVTVDIEEDFKLYRSAARFPGDTETDTLYLAICDITVATGSFGFSTSALLPSAR